MTATALRYQARLVTRNVREFAWVPGLLWVNWHEVGRGEADGRLIRCDAWQVAFDRCYRSPMLPKKGSQSPNAN